MRPDASWSASVTATVAIRNGTVSAKGFQVMVAHRQAYAVMAEVQIVSEPGLGGAGLRIGCNSEAAFLQTEGSDGVWVEVTPNAAPGEQDRAFAFDLSCLDGSGRGCTKAAQLLPAVAQCVRDGLDGSEHPLRNTQTPGVQGRH
jgi:hypothetical protein